MTDCPICVGGEAEPLDGVEVSACGHALCEMCLRASVELEVTAQWTVLALQRAVQHSRLGT